LRHLVHVRYLLDMSDLHEIEAAVRRLSADDVAAFGSWFDRFRASIATAQATGDLIARLKMATRAERRALAVRAAEESAEHYRHQPEEVLPDILDEPS
jgi:alpha-D-ribose 1-methylphosphonate 5-triphosphate synthase subunit PhnI